MENPEYSIYLPAISGVLVAAIALTGCGIERSPESSPTATIATITEPQAEPSPNTRVENEDNVTEAIESDPQPFDINSHVRDLSLSEIDEMDGITLRPDNTECTQADNLQIVDVPYRGLDGENYRGELVVHKDIAQDIATIMSRIYTEVPEYEFISIVRPEEVVDFIPADGTEVDNYMMEHGYTSGFNCRMLGNDPTNISLHGKGFAIDINPSGDNPMIIPGVAATLATGQTRTFSPPDGEQKWQAPDLRVALRHESPGGQKVIELFAEYGFRWGGDWQNSLTDYQHFDKE